MNQYFFDGMAKRALAETESEEDLMRGIASTAPFGTTLHSALAERPVEHSRFKEWASRVGGNLGGSALGYIASLPLALMLGHSGHLGPALGTVLAGSSVGGLVGEHLAGKAMVKKYYDKDGKLIRQEEEIKK